MKVKHIFFTIIMYMFSAKAQIVASAPNLTLSTEPQYIVNSYGFLKFDFLSTSREFNSDHKPITVKSTHLLITDDSMSLNKKRRSQTSIKNSRFGLNIDNRSKVKIKLEFDLDGENGNSPGTVTSSTGIIRVRQTNLSYKLTEFGTLTVGKKLDLFSPLNPHTYQVTTAHLWSGNTGFLTDGVEYIHKFGNTSVGLELKNAGAEYDTIKLSFPAAAMRIDHKIESHYFGTSAVYGTFDYDSQNSNASNINYKGINLFYNLKYMNTEIVLEGYYGENLGTAVTGAVGVAPLPLAINNSPLNKEQGFYISIKHKLDNLSLFGGYGAVFLDSDTESSAGNSFQGLKTNKLGRLGLDYNLDAGLTAYAEVALMNTSYIESSRENNYEGNFYDLGLIYKF